MSLFKYYNPNPEKSRVGDCPVRAICKATGQEWNRVYAALCAYGLHMKDMPSANHVWGRYLRELGYRRYLIDDDVEDNTVAGFCRGHPIGTYILAIDGHVVCAADGFYFDSWDSGNEIPIYYWVKEENRADP